MKKIIIGLLIGISILSVGCNSSSGDANSQSDVNKEFTLSELSEYDGKDGKSAYVAVDGVVYDVSNIDAWKNGQHNGLEAGNDNTELFSKSPHKSSIFEKIPVVGILK